MARRNSSQQSKYSGLLDLVNKNLGAGSAQLASDTAPKEFLSSGCLSLDFALGGGWPKGHMVGVFGPRDIGKSTIVGLSAVREAQKQGLNCAWIAVEPGFDPEWARKNGVDPEDLFIVRPDTGEKAFEALYLIVMHDEPKFDLIVFDSLGALLAETEISGKTGNDGKMKAGGQAGLITWGTKRVVTPISKRRQVCIMLNQVRDNMASTMGGFKQPGGHAVEHMEEAIVQLKAGPPDPKFVQKEHGAEVRIGQQIVAIVIRNKSNQGSRQRAVFDFFNKEWPDMPFGIDVVGDVLATGLRVGVIERGGAYYTLPGSDEKLLGRKAVEEYFDKNPKALDTIKASVIEALKKKDKA